MPLQPGDMLLNGQYRIMRQIGRGGFGFVYLAQHVLLREEVAVKELVPGMVGDEEMLKRFLAEARATMRLTHERIVRTHEVFSERGNYYIAMEYMAGGSLEARLEERGALPIEEAVHVAADVAEGLAYAHARGVVHCDLKPANILFTADGRAKVADFGIAHIPAEMMTRVWRTTAGFVAGSLPYMSPEQLEGIRDDPRVDIYALGAVLYRMLTGCSYLDFEQSETPGAQIRSGRRIQEEPPSPPSRHNGRVPAGLDAVVLKALAKRPEDRFAGAGQLRAALVQRDALSAPTRLAPTSSRKKRRGIPAGLLAAGGVLLVGIILLALWLIPDSRLRLAFGQDAAPTTATPATASMPEPPTMTTPDIPTEASGPALAAPPADTPAATETQNPTPTATFTETPAPTATYTETPAPTPTESPSPAPTATAFAVVQKDGTNIRSGPGAVYNLVVTAPKGASFVVVAQSPDGGWLRLDSSDERWIPTDVVTSTGNLPAALTIPPTPSPVPVKPGVASLISPYNGFTAPNSATFQWRYSGPALNSNQGFELLLWQDGVAGQPGAAPIVSYVAKTGYVYTVTLGNIKLAPGVRDKHLDSLDVRWTVAVVQRSPYRRLTIASSRWFKCTSSE